MEKIGIKNQNMKSGNIIQEKTYTFAIRIVQAYKYLVEEKKEYVLSKQLLRCGTSIGGRNSGPIITNRLRRNTKNNSVNY